MIVDRIDGGMAVVSLAFLSDARRVSADLPENGNYVRSSGDFLLRILFCVWFAASDDMSP